MIASSGFFVSTVNEAPVSLASPDGADAAVTAAREAAAGHGHNGHPNGHHAPPASVDVRWPNDPYPAAEDR